MKGFKQVPVELLPPCPRCGEPIRSVFVSNLSAAVGRRDLAEPCGHRLSEDEALAVMKDADEMLSRSRAYAPAIPAGPPPGPLPG